MMDDVWMVEIETSRLLLRPWRAADVAPMARINADPEVMRWIGDGRVLDEAATRARLEAAEHGWAEHGFGLFAAELRATGELIGFAGLAVPHFLPEVLPAVEAGWRLGRAAWGRGLATEAATAVLSFGFEDRGLARIISIVQRGNSASERVVAKLGMTPEREVAGPSAGRPLRVYELTADRFRAGVPYE
jgi:RimJ/RimL family protein N-acetyltransferase